MMARSYFGDIEGKCWFGVQNSNCADRFGYIGDSILSYSFNEEHLPKIKDELNRICLFTLGQGNLKKLDEFFNGRTGGYNFEEVAEYLNQPVKETQRLLSEYADYKLGLEIKKCIEENGDCFFEVEL